MKRIAAILMVLMLIVGSIPLSMAAPADEAEAPSVQLLNAIDGCPDNPTGKHTWVKDYFEKPTCTKGGYGVRYCTRCGIQNRFEEGPLGHNWGDKKVDKAPTCTTEGRDVRTCKRCGLKQYTTTKALGHDWGKWYVVTEPSPLGPGKEERDCKRCGLAEYREIPYTGSGLTLNGVLFAPESGVLIGHDASMMVTVINDDPSPMTNILVYMTEGDWQGDPISTGVQHDFGDSVLLPGQSMSFVYTHTVTNDDFVFGPMTYRFQAEGYPVSDSKPVQSNDWMTSVPLYEIHDAQLKLEVTGAPASALPALGMHVPVSLRVTNVDAEQIARVEDGSSMYLNYAPAADAFGAFPENAGWLIPGAFFDTMLNIQVTQEDLDVGEIRRVAVVSGSTWVHYEGENEAVPMIVSNEVIIVIPLVLDPYSMLKIVKKEVSQPKDPAGYAVGEKIRFFLDVYNLTDTVIRNVLVRDNMGGTMASDLQVLLDYVSNDDAERVVYEYTVQPEDVLNGSLVNIGIASWIDQATQTPMEIWSNRVIVNVIGGSNPGLGIHKTVVSTPKGAYYVEGEQINYVVTLTNNTDQPFYNVNVTDPLQLNNAGILDIISKIEPHTQKVLALSYTVTAADVKAGQVTNVAAYSATGFKPGTPGNASYVPTYDGV